MRAAGVALALAVGACNFSFGSGIDHKKLVDGVVGVASRIGEVTAADCPTCANQLGEGGVQGDLHRGPGA
ncbi:MAG: hypothetical protein R2939_06020 [Kofleriaceae bacterium]